MSVRVILAAVVGLIAFAIPTSAFATYSSAPLNICNRSTNEINVAVGYHSVGVNDPSDHSILTGPFVSRGFWAIEPGRCQSFDNPFSARYMFWFGYGHGGLNDNPNEVWGMRFKAAPDSFCVVNYWNQGGHVPGFTFEGENASADVCEPASAVSSIQLGISRGVNARIWVHGNRVDTWVDPNVNFTGQ